MRVIRWVVASLVCFLVGLAPVSVFAQTAEELVAKNLQARGGVEKMKAIKDEAGYKEAHLAYIRAVTRLAAARRS